MKKLTPEQKNTIISYCKQYQPKFGLLDWKIEFKDDTRFHTSYITDKKTATIFLAKEHSFVMSDNLMKKIAKHEMIHIMLADLIEQAQDREFNKYTFKRTVKQLVKRITNLID